MDAVEIFWSWFWAFFKPAWGFVSRSNFERLFSQGEVYVLYIKMENPKDFTTWLQVAKCFRIWDLDARGYHNSMWRMRMKGSDVMIVGVPNSIYSWVFLHARRVCYSHGPCELLQIHVEWLQGALTHSLLIPRRSKRSGKSNRSSVLKVRANLLFPFCFQTVVNKKKKKTEQESISKVVTFPTLLMHYFMVTGISNLPMLRRFTLSHQRKNLRWGNEEQHTRRS